MIRQDLDGARAVYRHSGAPFVSRITFHWVIDLLAKGYAAPLEAQDLGELPAEESAARQFEKFRRVYDQQRVKGIY